MGIRNPSKHKERIICAGGREITSPSKHRESIICAGGREITSLSKHRERIISAGERKITSPSKHRERITCAGGRAIIVKQITRQFSCRFCKKTFETHGRQKGHEKRDHSSQKQAQHKSKRVCGVVKAGWSVSDSPKKETKDGWCGEQMHSIWKGRTVEQKYQNERYDSS